MNVELQTGRSYLGERRGCEESAVCGSGVGGGKHGELALSEGSAESSSHGPGWKPRGWWLGG